MRAVGLLAAVAVAVSSAACGEDGVSKSEYLAKAKAVCQKGNEALTEASNAAFAKVPPGRRRRPPPPPARRR